MDETKRRFAKMNVAEKAYAVQTMMAHSGVGYAYQEMLKEHFGLKQNEIEKLQSVKLPTELMEKIWATKKIDQSEFSQMQEITPVKTYTPDELKNKKS